MLSSKQNLTWAGAYFLFLIIVTYSFILFNTFILVLYSLLKTNLTWAWRLVSLLFIFIHIIVTYSFIQFNTVQYFQPCLLLSLQNKISLELDVLSLSCSTLFSLLFHTVTYFFIQFNTFILVFHSLLKKTNSRLSLCLLIASHFVQLYNRYCFILFHTVQYFHSCLELSTQNQISLELELTSRFHLSQLFNCILIINYILYYIVW